MEDNINGGFILLPRKIQKSEIWLKPSDWIKVWVYILQMVNYSEQRVFARGSNLFNCNDVARECLVSYNTVQNFLKWGRAKKLITTRKTTRGVFINVLNYAKYQDLESYKDKTGTRQPPNRDKIGTEQTLNRDKTIRQERERKRKKEKEDAGEKFQNILLGDDDYNALVDKFGLDVVNDSLEGMSSWYKAKGRVCDQGFYKARVWIERDLEKSDNYDRQALKTIDVNSKEYAAIRKADRGF